MRRLHQWAQSSRPYLLGLGLALLGIAAVAAKPVSLTFETEALDLDTGITVARDPLRAVDAATGGADFYVAYHAGWSPGAVVMPLPGTAMDMLHGSAFAEVTAADIDAAAFSEQLDDVPFEAGSTVLVRTDWGAVYKVGNASETDTGVTVDFAQLQ